MKTKKTPKEVVKFLYNTANELKHGKGDVQKLPTILVKYANATQLPILAADTRKYYEKIQKEMLPKLSKADPVLHEVLQKFCLAHPPLHGDASGSHVSYEMMHHNRDLIALAGTFIDCWNIIQ